MPGIIDKVKVSTDVKTRVQAGKRALSYLTRSGNALHDIDSDITAMSAIRDILRQQGEGKGKRFSGAKDTSLESNAAALQMILTDGNDPLARVQA